VPNVDDGVSKATPLVEQACDVGFGDGVVASTPSGFVEAALNVDEEKTRAGRHRIDSLRCPGACVRAEGTSPHWRVVLYSTKPSMASTTSIVPTASLTRSPSKTT